MALGTLFLIILVFGKQRDVSANRGQLNARDLSQFASIDVLGQGLAQLCIVWGIRLSLASNASLITLTLPVVTAVMAYFLLGERMTAIRWTSFALATVGVAQCSGINWKELNLVAERFLLGNFLVFLGICGNAYYNVCSKKLLVRYSPLQVLVYTSFAATAVLVPITLYVEPESFRALLGLSLNLWLCLLALPLFTNCVAMIIFFHVLKRLDATQAGLSNYLIPFFGVLLAILILHERLTRSVVLGGTLVLVSTLLITVYDKRATTNNV
jgi:drug/metabolite transporter (DMT)-like permease